VVAEDQEIYFQNSRTVFITSKMSVIMFGTTKGLAAQFSSQLLHKVDRPEKEQKMERKKKGKEN